MKLFKEIYTKTCHNCICAVWSNAALFEFVGKHRNSLHVSDSDLYFISQFQTRRLQSMNFKLSNQDIIHVERDLNSYCSHSLQVELTMSSSQDADQQIQSVKLIEQNSSELQNLEPSLNENAIIFLVNLTDYAYTTSKQGLSTRTLLQESLDTFSRVITRENLDKKRIYLLFTNFELFASSLSSTPFSTSSLFNLSNKQINNEHSQNEDDTVNNTYSSYTFFSKHDAWDAVECISKLFIEKCAQLKKEQLVEEKKLIPITCNLQDSEETKRLIMDMIKHEVHGNVFLSNHCGVQLLEEECSEEATGNTQKRYNDSTM